MKKYISVLVLVLVFCLASCQSSPYIKEPITKENGIGFAEYESWSLVSGMFPGLPVVLDLQHQDFNQDSIQYTIHADIGRYVAHRPKGTWLDQEFTIGNNSVICWTSIHSDFEDPDQFAFHDYGDGADDYHIVFTDIIIRCENHIIGYAVICFDRTAYITDDKELVKNITNGTYNSNGTSAKVFILEFKIVPITFISAAVPVKQTIVDPFKTKEVN